MEIQKFIGIQLLIAHITSKIIFMKYLSPVRPKLVPKLKVLRIYWNLAHSIFQICQSQFWCQKWFLLNIYHLLGPNWSKTKSVQNSLKFGTFGISNIPTSISMPKNFFVKYLPSVKTKSVPKLKMLRIY